MFSGLTETVKDGGKYFKHLFNTKNMAESKNMLS